MIYNNPLHINNNIICCFPTIDDEFEFIIVIHYKEAHQKKFVYMYMGHKLCCPPPPPPTPSMLKRKQTF